MEILVAYLVAEMMIPLHLIDWHRKKRQWGCVMCIASEWG
jgi:hypothetical protein